MSSAKTIKGLKHKIKALLDKADYDSIIRLSDKHPPILRFLISMTYDKGDVTSWRAMEAVGKLTSRMSAERARHVIQRLLWMMREESGSNAWSAAEIIGEIIRNNPDPFEDIVPVLMSFHEEDFLRPGVLFAISRIAKVRPDLVAPFSSILLAYLESPRPEERGLALFAIGNIGKKEHLSEIERLLDDNKAFSYYDGESLVERHLMDVAAVTIKTIQPR
jgi:hypothetical protein